MKVKLGYKELPCRWLFVATDMFADGMRVEIVEDSDGCRGERNVVGITAQHHRASGQLSTTAVHGRRSRTARHDATPAKVTTRLEMSTDGVTVWPHQSAWTNRLAFAARARMLRILPEKLMQSLSSNDPRLLLNILVERAFAAAWIRLT